MKPKNLSRRDWLRAAAAAAEALAVPAWVARPGGAWHPAPLAFAGAIEEQNAVPPTDVRRGPRYEATVPDTLDLAERAALAINALTRSTNPAADYATYIYVNLGRNPPTMSRQIHLYGKFMEGLALARQITGSELNQEVDLRWRQLFLRLLSEQQPPLISPEGGRQLAWIAIHCRSEKDSPWKQLGEQAVRRTLAAATHKDDYCFFVDAKGAMPTGWDATFQGWTLQGASQFCRVTGSSAARELADKLARYLKDHAQVFDRDARFLARHPSAKGPALHFHHNANALEGILEYALATGQQEFASFAKQGYTYARSLGSPLVGFFPEYINDWPDERKIIDCETCCVADMILLALGLTEAGQGDYWDDVDRYVRNQFAEMQMTQGDWIERLSQGLAPAPVGAEETADRVPERCVGAFGGWATANDFYAGVGSGIMNCCTGNGTRALHRVWEKMLEWERGTLRLDLLLNHASSWADVNSFIPYDGRVDVHVKKDYRLLIRAPEWVHSESKTECTVKGEKLPLHWEGRYVEVGAVKRGSVVTLSFPIAERTVKTTIGDKPYTLIIKGNEVVSIDPPGKNYPFYQREHYRGNKARWKKVARFVG